MFKFLTLQPEAFGLDISDLSLKIVKLEKKGKFLSLTSFGKAKIKPGIVEQGEIKNQAALAKIIQDGLNKIKGKKIKTKRVISSLPEKKAFLEVIQMPKMKREELKTAVPFEAENYIPLPIEKVYLDFQIIPPVYDHLDHFDILIAAISKEIVNPYVSCFKKAGLIPRVLEIEPQAISRALIKQGLSPFPVLIIDFGKTKTNFMVFSGYSLRFTTTIPISSQGLTEAISRTLKKDLGQAEKLKLKYGLEISGKRDTIKKEVFEAMVPALTDLVEQIEKYIDYYQTHRKHEHLAPDGVKIKKVLLCGQGANLKGLDNFLSLSLKIPVEFANPWINILPKPLKEVPELPFEESLGYTTALGLALRGIKEYNL